MFTAATTKQLPCTTRDPELFFADTQTVIDEAKRVCQSCVWRTACLSAALEREEPHGVWGGELLANGIVVAVKRGRGRPRKQPQVERAEPQAA